MQRHSSLLLAFVLSTFALAQSPAPQEAESPDFSKEAYVVEHIAHSITVEEDGSNVREVSAEIRMLADAGVKAFAVLNFTYTSANEVVDVDYVRVRKQDGNVIETPDYNIQEMPADITRSAPMYSDVREKHVTVKGLGVGDLLTYKVRFRVVKPQIAGQFWYEHNFSREQITRDERVELSIPKSRQLAVLSPEFKPEVTEQGGQRIYRWKFSNLEHKEKEERSSNRPDPPPSIQASTFHSWEEIGRWYLELQRERVAVTPAIEAKAKELTKGLATDDARLRAIYDFVALRVHYVGLDFGIGRYQPHSAGDVLSNEYGDCKDKHTLLAALLKAAGYDAWPALIHASRKLDPELPSPAQFNHVITVVSTGGENLWLDTTPEVAPFRLLLYPLRNRQALVMPTGKAPMLMATPANPPFPQEQRFIASGKLAANGVMTAHIEQRFRGDSEVLFRSLLRQLPQSRWQEGVQGLSYGIGFGGEVSNVSISPIEKLDEPLSISYDYVRKDYADWEHGQILVLMPPFGIENTDKKDKLPKEPHFLGSRGEVTYEAKIELPPGKSLDLPEDRDIVEPYAEYHTRNALEHGVLSVKRRLVVKQEEVPLAQWESLKNMAKQASQDAFNFLKLEEAGASVAGSKSASKELDRKFKEAFEALRGRDIARAEELLKQIIAADPNYRGAHFNLAIVLATNGRLLDALEHLRKEEELFPDFARSYETAANFRIQLRQYDEAAQELRKWLKIDPKSDSAQLRLAALFTMQGKYAESVEVLEAASAALPENTNIQEALISADLKAAKFDKALALLRPAAEAALKQQPPNHIRLNDIAYSIEEAGGDLALAKQCAELALTQLDASSAAAADEPAKEKKLTRDYAYLWDTAGWIYFRLGDTQLAESYVKASWWLSQQAVVAEHLGEIYQKLGRSKEAAHTYELALASLESHTASRPGQPVDAGIKADILRISERYKKLTGKPATDLRTSERLPNGKWTVSPLEELSRMRELTLDFKTSAGASARFEVLLQPGKPLAATFHAGSQALEPVAARLAHAKYRVEFPSSSKATLFRTMTLNCSPYPPCTAVIDDVESVAAAPEGVVERTLVFPNMRKSDLEREEKRQAH